MGLIFSAAAIADRQTVPVETSGPVTAYVSVPAGMQCPAGLPDQPTAFCTGSGGLVYHLYNLGHMQGAADPDQLYGQLMQLATANGEVQILEQYSVPAMSQYRLQRDAPLLFLRGEQVYAYGFDATDAGKNESSVSAIVISVIPNNGVPMTSIDAYAISLPSPRAGDLRGLRGELVQFVNSYRYDEQWVQTANVQTVGFENNLRARENTFYSTQQRIHQNNMDALDSSYNAYRDRSAASDRMQSRTVDAIHERQQLIDPTTGTRYEADGYYDYNYVNPNDPDMSVRTNDALWDPNQNNNQGEYYQRLEEYDRPGW